MFIAVLTIVLAIAISFARFSLPFMDEYRDELITFFSEQLDQPLDVTAIVAEWHGMGPRIRLVGLALLDKEGGAPLLVLNSIVVGIDILETILTGSLQINSVILDGVGLTVTRDESGNILVQGLGATPQGASGRGGQLFAAWLLSRDHIAITANQIKWQDKMRGGVARTIRELSIELRNDRNRHQLEGSALLPDFEDQRITFAIDMRGDILGSQAWGGKAYIEAKAIRVGQLPVGLLIPGLRAERGIVTAKVWATWRDGVLHSVSGRAEIENPLLTKVMDDISGSRKQARQFDFTLARGDFLWQRQRQGWGLALKDFVLERGGRHWPSSEIQFFLSGGDQGAPEVAARLSYLDAKDATDFFNFLGIIPGSASVLIDRLRPAGRLYSVSGNFSGKSRFDISASFQDLEIEGDSRVPMISGVDGRFMANERTGFLQLSSAAIRVAYKDVLRAPLILGHVDGGIEWEKSGGQGWFISTKDFRIQNKDIQLRASGRGEWSMDEAQSPWMDLLIGFTVPDISVVSRYLPAGVMRPGLVAWLDRAFPAGHVPYGEVMLYGPLRAFPFAGDEGVFEVRFNVEDGILDYAPGWPRIEEVEAEVVFNNKSMAINITEGKSLSSSLKGARASIDDLAANPALLVVEGEAEGPASDILRYILDSPLNKKFGPYFNESIATGQANISMLLKKKLAPGTFPEIDGHLKLMENKLTLSRDGLSFENLAGELGFTHEGLYAHDIEATVLGMKADINIQTAQEAGQLVTHIYSVGTAGAEKIAELLAAPLFANLEGEALWNAAITIPPVDPTGMINASLQIRSDLKGVAINLPFPLEKASDDTLDLSLNIPLPRSRDAPLTFRLGEVLHGILDVDEKMSLERGEIVFGDEMARLPDHYGLRLSGSMPFFSFSKWLPYMEDSEQDLLDNRQSLIRSISVEVGQLEIFGHVFHDTEVRALWRPDYWDISAISEELKGDIEYPRKEGRALAMDLEYLHIRESEGGGGDDMDPRDLPELQVNSRLLTLHDIQLGALELRTQRRSKGVHIGKLSLASEAMEIAATGDWLSNGRGGQWSDFNVVLDSDNLGKALAQLGFVESINEGVGHIEISARWEGSPMSFSREKAAGTMSLRIENGRLVDIEPGAGRVFGLVNLRALPRRLSLDFSDIFNKGFAFDHIKGDFVFSKGIASTRDLKIKGPAAKIEIEGKINLVERSYDQVVTVMPEVSSGLPVAGAVVGGVGVGAAILLAEQLFKPEIEKATRVKYSVTGSWDDPVITPLQ